MTIREAVSTSYRVEEDALGKVRVAAEMMALNIRIGCEKAAKISLTVYRGDLTLRDAAWKPGFPTGGQFDAWVHPEEKTHPLGGDQ